VRDWLRINFFSFYNRLRKRALSSNSRFLAKAYLRMESCKRRVMGWDYTLVTFNELNVWVQQWVRELCGDYDVIAAIPRSGLLVGSLVALKLGKPLSTPDLLCDKRYWISQSSGQKPDFKNILLVDDSISAGKTMRNNLHLLRVSFPQARIATAALIAAEESKRAVDFIFKVIPHPRIFEWNMLHVKRGVTVLDLDGVICKNCPPGVDADEKAYISWIQAVKPYLIPAFEIDMIISCRLERYRDLTEKWLKRHNVRYKDLILWDIGSKRERHGKYARHKIKHILRYKPEIIWESNLGQAKAIWQATKIPTLCIDDMVLLG